MADIAQQKTQTGNTVYLMVGSTVVGRAQSLSGERSFGTEGVYEIGSIMPQEHVYLKYTGSVNLERMRIKGNSLVDLGLAALGEEVLGVGLLDINVIDNLTGDVMITYRGCSIDSYSESFRANDIVTESARFYYLTSDRGGSTTSTQVVHQTRFGNVTGAGAAGAVGA